MDRFELSDGATTTLSSSKNLDQPCALNFESFTFAIVFQSKRTPSYFELASVGFNQRCYLWRWWTGHGALRGRTGAFAVGSKSRREKLHTIGRVMVCSAVSKVGSKRPLWCLSRSSPSLRKRHSWPDQASHNRQVVLQLKNIFNRAVEAISSEMRSGGRVD